MTAARPSLETLNPISYKRHRFPSEVRFLATHAAVYNVFNLQPHLIRRSTLRQFRAEAHRVWAAATAAA